VVPDRLPHQGDEASDNAEFREEDKNQNAYDDCKKSIHDALPLFTDVRLPVLRSRR